MTAGDEVNLRCADPVGWARAILEKLDRDVRENLLVAYGAERDSAGKPLRGGDGRELRGAEYLEAAAILHDYEKGEFEGLVGKLQQRGIRSTSFREAVRKKSAELREAEKARAAQAAATGATKSGGAGKRESQATALVKLAQGKCELFHFGDDCFASVDVDGHLETHRLRNRAFKRWLVHEYMLVHDLAPNGESISAAITTLSGFAQFKGVEQPTFVRVAGSGGNLYLDLCGPEWRVVCIDSNGWSIVESADCPVRFRRAHGMKWLQEPKRGGLVTALREFLNVNTDEDFMLAVAWLVACFRDRGPYPILAWAGEQGAAKSTSARVLRECIDPNASALRGPPREPRDLAIAASNSMVVGYDNLSRIPEWLSDALCRLATGGGFGTRSLFTDDEEQIFESQRPCIIAAIGDVVGQPDLVDRGIFVTAPNIHEDKRRTEEEFWAAFHEEQPNILGALLDGVSAALKNMAGVVMKRKPRMADFAVWCEAAGPAFGWEQGAFLAAYEENRAAASTSALQTLLAESIQQLPLPWLGTSTALLAELEQQFRFDTPDGVRFKPKPKDWPSTANVIGMKLRQIAPNLRKAGIEVEFARPGKSGSRLISLTEVVVRSESTAKTSSASSAANQSSTNSTSFSGEEADNDHVDRQTPSSALSADSKDRQPENPANSKGLSGRPKADKADNKFVHTWQTTNGDNTQKLNGAIGDHFAGGYCPACGSFNRRLEQDLVVCRQCGTKTTVTRQSEKKETMSTGIDAFRTIEGVRGK